MRTKEQFFITGEFFRWINQLFFYLVFFLSSVI